MSVPASYLTVIQISLQGTRLGLEMLLRLSELDSSPDDGSRQRKTAVSQSKKENTQLFCLQMGTRQKSRTAH